jgi:hypothetical protein
MSAQRATTREDITCHKTGEPIPLDRFSCSKWSDDLYLVWCPTCHCWHGFCPTAAAPHPGGDGEERR